MNSAFDKSQSPPVMHARGNVDTIGKPCLADLKIDGELAMLTTKNSRLTNKYGRQRWNCPITNQPLPDGIFMGELYWQEGKDFFAMLRNKTSDQLKLALWDVIEFHGENIQNLPFLIRRRILESLNLSLCPTNQPLSIVPEWRIETKADLEALKTKIFTAGFEGLVLKDPQSTYFEGTTIHWAKIKNEIHEIFWVWGFSKSAKILSLLIGDDQKSLSHCGSGLTFEEKESVRQVLKQHIIGQTKGDYLVERRLQIKVKHYGYIRNEAGEVNSLRMPIFENFVF